MGQTAGSFGVVFFGLFREIRSPHSARPLFFRTRWPDAPAAESGFSLIGLLAAMIIAVIVTAATVYYLNLSNTRGEAMYQSLNAMAQASQNFARDTGCYPANVAAMGTPGADGQAAGLEGCTPNDAQWDGPYITQTDVFPGGNLTIPASDSGMPGTTAAIETGDWLSQNPEMAGRGSVEIAVVVGPLSASAQAGVCKHCNGCAEQGNTLSSTCFITGDSVGKVFASVN